MREEVIPILKVKDAAASVSWYARLGFQHEWTHRFEPGFPAFVSVVRGDSHIFLSEHSGDAPSPSAIYLRVSDIEVISEEFEAKIEEVETRREVTLWDPDGNRIVAGVPRTV